MRTSGMELNARTWEVQHPQCFWHIISDCGSPGASLATCIWTKHLSDSDTAGLVDGLEFGNHQRRWSCRQNRKIACGAIFHYFENSGLAWCPPWLCKTWSLHQCHQHHRGACQKRRLPGSLPPALLNRNPHFNRTQVVCVLSAVCRALLSSSILSSSGSPI